MNKNLLKPLWALGWSFNKPKVTSTLRRGLRSQLPPVNRASLSPRKMQALGLVNVVLPPDNVQDALYFGESLTPDQNIAPNQSKR